MSIMICPPARKADYDNKEEAKADWSEFAAWLEATSLKVCGAQDRVALKELQAVRDREDAFWKRIIAKLK